ncbi:MAG: thymidine phosphorylase [Oscillospiraceae bacterium]|nr:thymidine phosphorylase [Oscillospiraceae bacterium]
MTMYELITKKKHSVELTTDEINWIVAGFTSGDIPDYQVSAWLMAVCFSSMSDRETTDLTMAMARSGNVLELELDKFCADKHSTGGVGDKTTLILAPIAAACGIYTPKMSGRGLGHTGGTIDKLESIPGFSTSLNYEQFIDTVKEASFSVTGQTADLVPADKKLYALRDATATVDSIPLICSSIMSKKLATGADGIVLDVKVGDGAFMKTQEDAEKLAEAMVRTGKMAGKKCSAIITNMNKPLGRAVGNSIEVVEAIECLKGNGPDDLMEVAYTIAAEMLSQAGKGSHEECLEMAEEAVSSGAALEHLAKMIRLQGGDPSVINDYSKFKQAEFKREVYSPCDGYINSIACEKTGLIAMNLGAGRKVKGEEIDHTAGIYFNRTVGERVCKGDLLCTLYTSREVDLDTAEKDILTVFSYAENYFPEKNVKKIIKGY